MRQPSDYELLKNKWYARHKETKENLWSKHKYALKWVENKVNPKRLIAGSLSGLMLLNTPSAYILAHPHPNNSVILASAQTLNKPSLPAKIILTQTSLISDLSKVLPGTVQPLNTDQDKNISQILSKYYGIDVSSQLQGIGLNRSYGLIGQEQHLALYPGDSMGSHLTDSQDIIDFSKYGMAPGLGAWGYFAPSKSQLTKEDILREKYYIAVPTFLSPGYSDHVMKENQFFKYKEMLVVNPQNGKAIICDIGDSGPAPFTGKHLGGSPEVMKYLDRVDGARKGPVLYYFLNDQSGNVPLGPIDIKN